MGGWDGVGLGARAHARTCALELACARTRSRLRLVNTRTYIRVHGPRRALAHGQRDVGTAGFVYYTRGGHVARGFVVFVEKGPCRFN